MRTQSKRLKEMQTIRQEHSITIGDQNLASQRNVSPGRRTCAASEQAEHHGYRLTARAEPVKSALHAAHLVIEGPGCPTPRCFHALDYFYDPAQALRYAIRWGRIWVDHRLAKAAAERVVSACREPHSKDERTNRADNHE